MKAQEMGRWGRGGTRPYQWRFWFGAVGELARGGLALLLLGFQATFAGSAFPTNWPAWKTPSSGNGPVISNAMVEVRAATPRGMELRIAGHSFAWVNPVSTIAYQFQGETHLTEISGEQVTASSDGLICHSSWNDSDGATWSFRTRFTAHAEDIEAETEVEVSAEREVLFLPILTVFAGENSFGTAKGHALLAGVEYLDNEPSSSELDLVGAQSQRQVPPLHDLTFPLMTLQADERYIGVMWDEERQYSALFDSPDRLFGSHGHAMGIIWPPTDDSGREPGQVFPKTPAVLKPKQVLRVHCWLTGGRGDSVVPAIQQYVRLRGLPALPPTNTLSSYFASAEAGWLKSKIRVGDHYRHALAQGNFAPGPASDAAVFETWLASCESDAGKQAELREAAKAALAQVNPAGWFHSSPGHIRTPAAALLFGHLPEAIQAARADAAAQLGRFDSEGRVIYHPSPGGMDFGKGHFAPDANGYTAATLFQALESAAFSGDRSLIERGVERLRQQNHFHGTTPRGVQVWELALHTPDIMASSYLVRAYVDGYQLTGDKALLDEAVHWAWSGLPFVYLRNPAGKPIGPYATIAVYGATHWRAPNWIGLPVQWCGLVYSDALYRLAQAEPEPWKQVADGITWSGVQQSFPLSEPEHAGLLPDSFVLANQHRNPPDINPATLGASAIRLLSNNTIYDFRGVPENGLLIHAPCRVKVEQATQKSADLKVEPWEQEPFFILVNRLPAKPRVQVNGKVAEISSPNVFDEANGALILQLKEKSQVWLEF